MYSRPLQYRKSQFKETKQEPACQTYPNVWQYDPKENKRSSVVPTPAMILDAVTFLGMGDRFGQD